MNVTETTAMTAAQGVKAGRPADGGPSTVRRSASIAALAAAMAKAQAAIEDPTKNKKADAGPKTYRYADLPTVLDVVRPALSANNLAVMQFPCEFEGVPAVTTLLAHTSGEWIETLACLRPGKMDPQGIGSALTYMRRYSLLSLCGIAADDDDEGAAASRPQQQQKGDNLPMRAKASIALASCQTRDEYLATCQQIAADVKAGVLSHGDRDALAPIARETAARFPA
jgi:hypothetical protein